MMTARAQPTAGLEAQMVTTVVEAWDERWKIGSRTAVWPMRDIINVILYVPPRFAEELAAEELM